MGVLPYLFIFLRRGAGDVLNASGYHRLFPTAKRLTIITFRGCRRHFGFEGEESWKRSRGIIEWDHLQHELEPAAQDYVDTREREIVQRAGWCAVCSLLFSPPTPSCSVLSSYITFFDSAPFSRDERREVSPFPEQTPRRKPLPTLLFFGRASFVFKQVYCAYINIFHFFFSAGGVAGALGNRAAHHTILYFLLLQSYSTFISLTSTSAWTGVIKWNDWLFFSDPLFYTIAPCTTNK